MIARAGKPAVELVIVPQTGRKSRKDMFGLGIGKIWMSDDAFSPSPSAMNTSSTSKHCRTTTATPSIAS
jgi:hypothetical protein